MKKIIRVILLLSPLIIVGIAFFEHGRWEPPLNPNIPQPVSIETLLEHNESYQAPMMLITQGEVHNKSSDTIFLKGIHDEFFRVNCTLVNISAVQEGMTLYMRGYSYYHDPSKLYFLAVEIHIHTSYSLVLSIPIAFIVLIILFIGFKFNLNDFSFSRRPTEEGPDA